MNNKRNRYLILMMLIAAVFTSCKKQWDSHNAITDPAAGASLIVQINQNPDLSLFSQYLVKTRYDKVISSSKTFTVWAPTNAAIQAAQTLDATLATDTNKMKLFVGNHISYQSYTSSLPQPSLRIKMLNGKTATFTKTTFEEANIVKADLYTSNGILQIIDKAILPKLNIWDYVKSLTNQGLTEKNYLLSQNYPHQDTSKATVLSIDPLTGLPIYDPNTGIDTLNRFIDQTVNLKSEDSLFTFIVLTDNAFGSDAAKIARFCQTSNPVSTTAAINYNVTKDLVFRGLYSPANLPDTLVSLSNVKIAINKNLIVSTYNASNGIVYVIDNSPATGSGASFRLQDKYPPIVLQGENYTSIFSSSYTSSIITHTKPDPNGVLFTDFTLTGAANGVLPKGPWVRYNVTLSSVQYKVYWRAINFTTTAFKQLVSFGLPLTTGTNALPYISIAPSNYAEVFVGTYTPAQYGFNPAYIIGDNTTTTAGLNSVTLDYLKLVPVLQ